MCPPPRQNRVKYPDKLINCTITRFIAIKATEQPVPSPTENNSPEPVRVVLPFKDQASPGILRTQLGWFKPEFFQVSSFQLLRLKHLHCNDRHIILSSSAPARTSTRRGAQERVVIYWQAFSRGTFSGP